jgi:hypothetical protein
MIRTKNNIDRLEASQTNALKCLSLKKTLRSSSLPITMLVASEETSNGGIVRRKMMPKRGLSLLLLVVLCFGGGRLMAAPASSARAEYQNLLKEFDNAEEEARKAYQAAKTDAERQKASEKFPNRERFAERFLALVEKNPDSPVAVDSLIWAATQANHNAVGQKALDRLARDHAQSDKLGPLCDQLVYTPSDAARRFLQRVIEKNPNRDVQGKAHFALANQSRANAPSEAERLLTLVRDKYGNVKYGNRTLAEAAKAELYELQHLGIGRAAPEIKGADVDGRKFNLSDYRGKVVVLDFWGDW